MGEFRLIYPVANPVISQPFGVNWTGIPNFYTRHGLHAHEGMDFGGDEGDFVFAAADGVINMIAIPGKNVRQDHPYGIHIRITHKHDGQEYETVYAHLAGILNSPAMKAGAEVKAGDLIAYMGKTGTRDVHLHFTLKKKGASARKERQTLPDGTQVVYQKDVVNPLSYLPPLP